MTIMHILKDKIPVHIDAPGAVARQQGDFGAASGTMAAEYFSLATGTDIAPLLKGLKNDLCYAPHWGYVLAGEVEVSYANGESERCSAGDAFHWPGGHSVRVITDAEVILFSPAELHGEVIDHMKGAMGLA
ncbi:hypothetical protein [Janibacter cremeus]|nr:hypothetical protein [Janibacter cremeus]